MRKIVSLIGISIVAISTFLTVPSSAAVACPDTWNISATPGQITLMDKDTVPADYALTNSVSIEQIQIFLNMGMKYLLIKNWQYPLSAAFNQKILDGGRDIQVTGQWKVSSDGKTWRGLPWIFGSLLPEESATTYTGAPKSGTSRNINRVDVVYGTGYASRIGLTPNTMVAFEAKVDVKGCKQRIFYENISSVPEYTAPPTKSFDSIIEAHYLARPTMQKINFIVQKSCNETLNSFISHVRDVSSKSQTWTVKNPKRATLDLGWSLTGPENTTCSEAQGLPGIDLIMSPSRGDSCITLTTPYTNTWTYKTLKYPCSVSVDYGGFEVANFEISKPKTSVNTQSKTKVITCTNGTISKKVTGVSSKCPVGYKKK